MRVVWTVIVAATGAMSLIAASLLAQPHKQGKQAPPFEERTESHSVCLDCASAGNAIDTSTWPR